MPNVTQRFKAHRFAALTLSVAFLGVLVGAMLGWSGKANNYYQGQRQQTVAPRVMSVTSAVRVLSVGWTSIGNNSLLAVKLQNISEKDIKAYTIACGKAWVTRDYFLRDESFAAGATVDQFIPLSSDDSQDFKVPINGREYTITAVYFADGTSEGVPLYVSRLADQYSGILAQASRILPCLRRLSSTSVQDLATCKAEALNLPVKTGGRSSDYEAGLENAKQEILSQLNDIQEKIQMADLPEAAERQQKVIRVFQRLAETSH